MPFGSVFFLKVILSFIIDIFDADPAQTDWSSK